MNTNNRMNESKVTIKIGNDQAPLPIITHKITGTSTLMAWYHKIGYHTHTCDTHFGNTTHRFTHTPAEP